MQVIELPDCFRLGHVTGRRVQWQLPGVDYERPPRIPGYLSLFDCFVRVA